MRSHANQSGTSSATPRRALVTGATGYIGGELIQALIEQGWAVRALTRGRQKAEAAPWGGHVVREGQTAGPGQVEVHVGDAENPDHLARATEGIDTAWYLLHSMGSGPDFATREQDMARAFGRAARNSGVSRIIYLGGLHPHSGDLSEHLASRTAVGQILMGSGVPTAALQAGLVLGRESSSFIMLRNLSERLPGAVGPRWIRNRITPISVRDAVFFLTRAADLPAEVNRAFDIGGPDTMAYVEMMKRYARAQGLGPRVVLTAPVATPRLASQWMRLVTRIPRTLTVPLIGSLLHETVVKERDLESMVGLPEGGLQSFEQAVTQALPRSEAHGWRTTLLCTGAAVAGCAVVGSLLSDPQSRWYRGLRKPTWTPPPAAFPVAWSALYADIAVTQALVLDDARQVGDRPQLASQAAALGINLVLNASWSGLFFRARRPYLATAGAAVLTISSADLLRRTWRSSPQRGALLAPYAAWCGFATALSGGIARLNRSRR